MVSIEWCLSQRNGLEIVAPNKNMSESYLKMAEESIGVLNDIKKSHIWIATTSYYIFYYSLYSLMLRLGVKCEIHACSIEFMKAYLKEFYSKEDIEMIEKALSARINLQYYADRPVDKTTIEESRKYCKNFFIKTKEILSSISEEKTEKIRKSFLSKIKSRH